VGIHDLRKRPANPAYQSQLKILKSLLNLISGESNEDSTHAQAVAKTYC